MVSRQEVETAIAEIVIRSDYAQIHRRIQQNGPLLGDRQVGIGAQQEGQAAGYVRGRQGGPAGGGI